MKKRLEKKVEKIRRKKVHEILEMVLEINTTYPRQRKYTANSFLRVFRAYIKGFCPDSQRRVE